MSPQASILLAADLDAAGTALIASWGDGHQSQYPLALLRGECPCATCRAERQDAADNPLRVVGAAPSHRLTAVEPVGRYGLRLVWSDGHSTGIYTFSYLREICPCDACRSARPAATAPYTHGIHIP